jgi:threonine aldolase
MLSGLIDLRSDTCSTPTKEMRDAMRDAEIGGYGLREDPTVRRLEAMAAELCGKEEALFLPTTTMGNQISVHIWTRPGDKYIAEESAHIYQAERAGAAVLSAVQCQPVKGKMGYMDPADVEEAVGPIGILYPRATLLCVENTHSRSGGTVVTPLQMDGLRAVAERHDMKIHLDGARLLNASVALGEDVASLSRDAQSVAISLNKGLSAPVGAVLAGSQSFIAEALEHRQLFGGGWRQAGIVAAACIIALQRMVDRLSTDHENARLLAAGLAALGGACIDLQSVQTNIVQFELTKQGLSADELLIMLEEHGIKALKLTKNRIRMVTHRDISREDIVTVIGTLGSLLEV